MTLNMLNVQIDRQDDRRDQRGPQRGQRDGAELLPARGAVHPRRLVEVGGIDCSAPSETTIMNGKESQPLVVEQPPGTR